MGVRDLIPWKNTEETEIGRPLESLPNLAESMDRIFDDLWSPFKSGWPNFPSLAGDMRFREPEVDIQETPKEIIVSAALPGMEKENIHVDVTGNAVTIRAEQKTEDKHDGKNGSKGWMKSYQSFARTFTLPEPVKAGEAKANYKNGVLKIEMPKVKESKAHRVKIQ